MKVNINFIDNKFLESNHKILPNDDKTKSFSSGLLLIILLRGKLLL